MQSNAKQCKAQQTPCNVIEQKKIPNWGHAGFMCLLISLLYVNLSDFVNLRPWYPGAPVPWSLVSFIRDVYMPIYACIDTTLGCGA